MGANRSLDRARASLRLPRWAEWTEHHPWVTRTAVGLAAVSLALTAISPWYQIYVRDDESLPQYSFFILHKGAFPQRGEYVAFEMAQEYADRVQPAGFQRPYARVGKLWLK